MSSDQPVPEAAVAAPEIAQGLPIFYKNPVPLNAQEHRRTSLRKDFSHAFARHSNAVPLNVAEIAHASHVYPIAFTADEHALPMAIVGLRDSENLFLASNDHWMQGVYIPAYVRRYPFILSTMQDSEQLILCVDQPDEMLAEDDAGRFFDDNGNTTQLAEKVMTFCQSYNAAALATQAFSQALREAGVLTRHEVEVSIGADRRNKFSGFLAVDPDKLAALDDAVFLEWRRKGWLPLVYAHMSSEPHWQRLGALLKARLENEP
ncbi:MAG: SapC family protein [Wenzhouxiangella sp.]